MKNDAFTDNFPDKYFLSQAIHSGQLPLWNPYMNFGFPVYADVGFAFYNPITWVFALLGYNAYTFTAEVLLYIYLGGVFMYRLAKYFKFVTATGMAVAAMYMCSGFFAGCLTFINYLTAAAFLPLAVQTLLQLINKPCFKSSFLFAIACYFVFAGGHPYMPVVFMYFVTAVLVLIFLFNHGYRQNAKKILTYLAIAVASFTILYLPAVYSYLTIFPWYGRNYAAPQALNTGQGFTVSSYISFLFPFSTAAAGNIFNADVTMRNGYFSIAGFICAVLVIRSNKLYVRVFTIAAAVMLLLSMGGPFKAFLFTNLPLLGYIAHNGEFRVYTILCFCITAGFGLQKLQTGDAVFKLRLKTGLQVLVIVSVCIVIALLAGKYFSFDSVITMIQQKASFAEKVKAFLSLQFLSFLCVSVIIAVIICLLSLFALNQKKNSFLLFTIIIIADLCINCIIYLPVTGVGQVSLKTIQAFYNRFPKGIPIPAPTPVNKIDTLDEKTTGLVGDISYYNKLIGTMYLTDYPSYFTTAARYLNNRALVATVSKNPYVFVKGSASGHAVISVQKFSTRVLEMQVSCPQDDTLVLLQNNYPFWHALVNGQKVPITTAYTTFMSVKIDKGQNDVIFYYEDSRLGICILISLAAFITGISIIARQSFTYK